MARVTYGALITELAGSIGGITFQKNGSGNIARLKPNMPMISSPAQAEQQYKLSSLVAQWAALTLIQQTSWNDFAAAHDHINEFGETKTLNGFQWFMSCNLNLYTIEEDLILTAPAWYAVPPPSTFGFYVDDSNFDLEPDAAWSPAGCYTVCYVTSPIRQAAEKIKKSTYYLKYWDSHFANAQSIKNPYRWLFNLVWMDFYNTAVCTIVVRIKNVQTISGLSSTYTSNIVKFPV